jgi:UDP-N-acetylmuramate--alanine ligase
VRSRLHRPRKIHFVGIGGAGMSGIAEVLLTMGHHVAGSDMHASDATRHLSDIGARVFIGHDPAHLDPASDVVVISSAVKFANPEVVEARRLTIPVVPRAEMLAELMRMKVGVAIGGSHGKTTTTSLVGHIVARAGLDPTVVIGGKVWGLGSNARLGSGELMIAEADESDGSFLLLSPVIAVVTNIDPEHLDHYGTLERVKDAFTQFVNQVPFHGRAVVCLDDPNVRAILPQIRKRFVTYGTSADAEWTATDLAVRGMETSFRAHHRGEPVGEVRLRLPGRHHGVNALAALAVAHELEIPFEVSRAALEEFGGIQRRFEICGEEAGVLVVSDYGHHPTEIRATIAAAREGFDRRLLVVFQPHRYTRTRDLFDEFLQAFDEADVLLLTEVYAAGETPITGASGETLFRAIKRRGHVEVRFEAQQKKLADRLLPHLRSGDLVLVLGAGSIHDLGATLVRALGGREEASTVQ